MTVGYGVYILDSFEDFEDMCMVCPKVWGVANGIYKRTTGIILCLRREDVPGNAITQYVML